MTLRQQSISDYSALLPRFFNFDALGLTREAALVVHGLQDLAARPASHWLCAISEAINYECLRFVEVAPQLNFVNSNSGLAGFDDGCHFPFYLFNWMTGTFFSQKLSW